MKVNLPPKVVVRSGMTLIELTVIIVVLMLLITVMFIGSNAWKRGSDRAGCVLNLRNVQVATRSYQNIYGYNFGGRPFAENGTQDIAAHLFSKGYIEEKLFDHTRGTEPCPAGGIYTCPLPDIFPEAGQLYLKCSLSETDNHLPNEGTYGDW